MSVFVNLLIRYVGVPLRGAKKQVASYYPGRDKLHSHHGFYDHDAPWTTIQAHF